MRSIRLALFGASPCHLCDAACCRQNGHEYAVLLEAGEWGKFAAFSEAVSIAAGAGDGPRAPRVERVLPYRDGRCVFLGGDDRCTIYEDRPANCRRFECVGGYHRGGSDVGSHDAFLERNPGVREMLEKI